MIFFPQDVSSAWDKKGIFRAGATDVWDRYRKGLIREDIIDLRDIGSLHEDISISEEGEVVIPAMTTIREVGDKAKNWGHRALEQAANELATPAIRNVATLGGNIMQEVRCSYFRSGMSFCHKTGGQYCLAREGDQDCIQVRLS